MNVFELHTSAASVNFRKLLLRKNLAVKNSERNRLCLKSCCQNEKKIYIKKTLSIESSESKGRRQFRKVLNLLV